MNNLVGIELSDCLVEQYQLAFSPRQAEPLCGYRVLLHLLCKTRKEGERKQERIIMDIIVTVHPNLT